MMWRSLYMRGCIPMTAAQSLMLVCLEICYTGIWRCALPRSHQCFILIIPSNIYCTPLFLPIINMLDRTCTFLHMCVVMHVCVCVRVYMYGWLPCIHGYTYVLLYIHPLIQKADMAAARKALLGGKGGKKKK